MTRAQYREVCIIVGVLADLLAQEVRSYTPPGRAGDGLEHDVEAIPARFAAIAKGAITTARERAQFRRNFERDFGARGRRGARLTQAPRTQLPKGRSHA